MKRYNMIKNLMIASATATLYNGYVVDGVALFPKVCGTLAIFVLMLVLMRDADKQFLKRGRGHERETA